MKKFLFILKKFFSLIIALIYSLVNLVLITVVLGLGYLVIIGILRQDGLLVMIASVIFIGAVTGVGTLFLEEDMWKDMIICWKKFCVFEQENTKV